MRNSSGPGGRSVSPTTGAEYGWRDVVVKEGEWAGWTDEFVRDQMTRPAQALRPYQRLFMSKIVDEEWAKLAALLD